MLGQFLRLSSLISVCALVEVSSMFRPIHKVLHGGTLSLLALPCNIHNFI